MRGPMTARKGGEGDVFARIGAFLSEQGLSPEPSHYSFAYSIVTEPDGVIAQAVRRLTDGGFRLQRGDIESLGGKVSLGASAAAEAGQPRQPDISHADALEENAARLVAETQAQVADFTTMMQAMQNETRGFGRDLAESAAAITAPQVGHAVGLEAIARITGTMLARVRDAEARLASATREAEALRAKLDEANDTARRDALTGLPNRRAFEESFVTRPEHDGPYCLAVADIDRFKRINAIHGHPVGDRVLCAVGRLLVEECAGQLVVRHGGEEFAILLRGMTLAQAADHLDSVRAMMAAKRFRIRESDQPLGSVTMSIGVTAVQFGEDSATAFDRADRLLYTAKAEGRDRVCAA